ANDPVKLSQWIASVCLDDLVEKHNLTPPDAVKIDIDGFEMRALEGAKSLLSSGKVKTWCIESNDNNQDEIIKILTRHGYYHEGEYVHYPEMKEMSPRDLIFYKG
nr:FkbM family methyltransferase [Micavibrio sp.]